MNNLSKQDFLKHVSTFNSPNDIERQQAYQYIESLIKTYPVIFTQHCMDFLENSENLSEQTIQIILTLLKRALKNGPQDNSDMSIWLNLDKQMKEQLLQCAFQIILHSSSQIKKQGADLVSIIFCQDRLYEKIWTNIIDSLSKNVSHQQQDVREAAIYSLSYICEYTHDRPEIILTDAEIESLLSGIFNSLQKYDQLTLAAVEGLKYATDFVLQRMHISENLETSDYVFNILIELLIKCRESPSPVSEQILIGTITCLRDICEGFFDKLANYKDIIFQKILGSLSLNPDIVNSIFFFFQGIFEMEYIKNTDYTKNIYTEVQEAVVEFLLKYKDLHFSDEGGSSLTQSSFLLLKYINQIYIQQNLQRHLNFVYTNIEIPNIAERCAALIVFRSLIQYSDPLQIEEPLQNGFQSFLGLVNSNQQPVITQTLLLFKEVSEHASDVLFGQQNNKQIVSLIQNIISNPLNYNEIDFNTAFSILHNMTEQIPNKNRQMTKGFREELQKLMQFICTILFDTNELQTIDYCFTFFISVITTTSSANEILQLFDNFKDMLIQTTQNASIESEKNQKIICDTELALNVILLNLNQYSDAKNKFQTKYKDCIEIYKICQEHMRVCKELLSEPFELMSQILLSFPDNPEFKAEVKNFVRNFVTEAIKMEDQMIVYIKGVNVYNSIIMQYKLGNDSEMENICTKIFQILTTKFSTYLNEEFFELQRVFNDYISELPNWVSRNQSQVYQHLKALMKDIICNQIKQFKSKNVELLDNLTFVVCEYYYVLVQFQTQQGNNNYSSYEDQNLQQIFQEFFYEYTRSMNNIPLDLAIMMVSAVVDPYLFNSSVVMGQDLAKYIVLFLEKYPKNQDTMQFYQYLEECSNIRIDNMN